MTTEGGSLFDEVLALRDERIRELVAEVDSLQTALESRAEIDQAKGIIMGAIHCTPDAAFAVLVHQSMAQHRKVREIAAEIVSGAISQRRRSTGTQPDLGEDIG